MKSLAWVRVKQPTQIMGETNTTIQAASFDKLYQVGAFVMLESKGKEFGIPLSNVLCLEFEATKKRG